MCVRVFCMQSIYGCMDVRMCACKDSKKKPTPGGSIVYCIRQDARKNEGKEWN